MHTVPVNSRPEKEAAEKLPAGRESTRWTSRLVRVAESAVSFPVLMGGVLVVLVVAFQRLRMPDPDTWWHFTIGELILRTHRWPASDVYSFTAPGHPWIAYEWLGEVVMALAARAGVLPGLTALLLVLVSALTLLIYFYATSHSGSSKAACIVTALTLPLASMVYTMRPQLLGYIFMALTLVCLELFRQGRRRTIWILPPVFALWANTHGTFAFGLALIGLCWFGGLFEFEWGGLEAKRWTLRERIELELLALLCLVSLTITPYGTRLAAYPLELVLFQPGIPASIEEWQPIGAFQVPFKFFLALFLLFVVAAVVLRVKFRLDEFIFVIFTTYATFLHVRFALVFLLAFIPVAAKILGRWVPPYDRKIDKFALNAILLAATCIGLVKYFPSQAAMEAAIDKDYPRGAIEYIRAHPHPAHLLNDYGWGGYLIWQLGSNQKLFIDGRADFYEYAGVLDDYLHVMELKSDAFRILQKYDVEACLLRRDASLATVLERNPDWKKVYSDGLSVVFIRRDWIPRVAPVPPSPLNAQL